MNKCLIFSIDRTSMYRRGSGAYRIASYLRENDWDTEVIDFAGYWTFFQLTQLAKQRFTDNVKFVGFSYLFIEKPIPEIEMFGNWIKKNYPYIKIIFGGPNIYRYSNSYKDYNVHGFGEVALLELLKYLFSNGPLPKFSLLSAVGKAISANDVYPSFPMNSLMIKYEDRDFIQPYEWLGVEFARGCKFACAFCSYPVLGVKGDYSRDAKDFELQMRDAYDRFGITKYYVSDETFNDRTEKITKFADVVEKLNFMPFFTGFIRGDLLVNRPADKEELLRMGFLGQFYGVETFYHETGKIVGKGMDPKKLKDGLIEVKNYFENNGSKRYRGHISLIAGLPKEPVSSLYESGEWLRKNWQGQAFSFYPLEIPLSDFDKPSKIALDWAKYGYADASKDLDIQEYSGASRTATDYFKTLIWKNEHMNLKEADKIAKYLDNIKYIDGNDFRQGSFSLLRLGLPTDIDEALKVPEGVNFPRPVEFINNYITAKLGL